MNRKNMPFIIIALCVLLPGIIYFAFISNPWVIDIPSPARPPERFIAYEWWMDYAEYRGSGDWLFDRLYIPADTTIHVPAGETLILSQGVEVKD